jgi:hypothetical protein
MGQRRFPRPGAAVRGLTTLLLGALLAAPTAGCGAPEDAGTTPRTASAAAGSPLSPVSDADLCARVVAYWAREVLGSGTYGDYQSMGLSNGQYAILRDVVDAAREAGERRGAAAADRLIGQRARAACTERYRAGPPSGGPWR